MFDELSAIQQKYGFIPADQLRELSKKIDVPISQIHAVASFYPHFNLTPPPRLDIRVCTDMTCHLYAADALSDAIKLTAPADGKEVTVRPVSCLGRCDSAPAMVINDVIYSGFTPDDALALTHSAASGRPLPPPQHRHTPVKTATDPYGGVPGDYRGIRELLATRDFFGVITTLKASGLRGLGGAGFPTGSKWEIVRNAIAKRKYIVCNADESEPGTIKDRFILEHMPYLVVEGMIFAALVTGAREGYVYIRHEYEHQRDVVEQEIQRAYSMNALGRNIFGSDHSFDLRVFVSPGGYICGEETALLEAIEGKRAEPRNKPPFPGNAGLFQMPTVINNVETFLFAAAILIRGLEWYKAQGKNGVPGLKFVGVSGDVNRPGVFEVPMGTTYRELIDGYSGGVSGGRKLLGFAPSGPSSGYLPASMLDLPLDFAVVAKAGSMVGSGAIVVCAEDRCMLDMALNAVRFFRNESCGKCVPCRMGSQKLVDLLSDWTHGKWSSEDMQSIEDVFKATRLSSICGLGQILNAPIASVIKNFPDTVREHLEAKYCRAGVCFRSNS